jgi:hypothetical protein
MRGPERDIVHGVEMCGGETEERRTGEKGKSARNAVMYLEVPAAQPSLLQEVAAHSARCHGQKDTGMQ